MTTSTISTNLEDQLADALDDYPNVDPASEKTEFIVETEEQAVWAARKVVQYAEQIADRDRVAQAQIDRITAWRDDANKDLRRSLEFFENLLEGYHRRALKLDPKRKTVKLPGLRTQIRQGQPSWQFDDDAFVASASLHVPDLVRIASEPNKAEAKKQLVVLDAPTVVGDEDGVVVPGARALEDGAAVDAAGEVLEGVSIVPAGTVVTADGVVLDGVTVKPPIAKFSITVEPAAG